MYTSVGDFTSMDRSGKNSRVDRFVVEAVDRVGRDDGVSTVSTTDGRSRAVCGVRRDETDSSTEEGAARTFVTFVTAKFARA